MIYFWIQKQKHISLFSNTIVVYNVCLAKKKIGSNLEKERKKKNSSVKSITETDDDDQHNVIILFT